MRLFGEKAPTQTTPDAEQLLVRRAQAGDTEAFRQLYEKYIGRVYLATLRFVRDTTVAEDLAQDTFVAALTKLHTFRHESRFGTWLHRIAMNTSLMYLRRQNTQGHKLSLVSSASDEPDTAEIIEIGRADDNLRGTLDRVIVERALSDMPTGYRKVLEMHDLQGYEHHEIASMMGVTTGTSKSQLHKARLKLKNLVQAGREREEAA